ncbi:MAG: glycosyltransferase [Elusimicrobiota bacterium]|nr:glycosyltransferase [Endomicrobiia bacterium]MDW8165818.1 glycosyltransferase [Elusimicrobiota bacterium]
MKELKFVSIIVPIKNSERTLLRHLESIKTVDYPKDKFEVIYVDGGSTDKTLEILKSWKEKNLFQMIVIELKNCKSPGEARNKALEIAKGEYVLFTDADCVVKNDWIKQIISPFEKDEKIGIVGGEIHTLTVEDGNDIEKYLEFIKFLSVNGRCNIKKEGYFPDIKNFLPHEVNGNIHSSFFATANLAVKKDALLKIGNKFWDEITGEDVDFNIRINKQGYKLYFMPSAIVYHIHRANLKQFRKQLYGYGYGHPLLIKKHAKQVLELCLNLFGKYIYIPIPFFIKGNIYLGSFHFMHIFLILAILSIILNWSITSKVIFIFLFLLFKFKYFAPLLKLSPLSKFPKWCKIKYLSNLSFILGGIKGSFVFGAIDLEDSF